MIWCQSETLRRIRKIIRYIRGLFNPYNQNPISENSTIGGMIVGIITKYLHVWLNGIRRIQIMYFQRIYISTYISKIILMHSAFALFFNLIIRICFINKMRFQCHPITTATTFMLAWLATCPFHWQELLKLMLETRFFSYLFLFCFCVLLGFCLLFLFVLWGGGSLFLFCFCGGEGWGCFYFFYWR